VGDLAEQRELAPVLQIETELFRQSVAARRSRPSVPRTRNGRPDIIQLSMLNGWGGYILTEANYVNAFFSHDEFIDFFAANSAALAEIRETLGPT
jgi:hypothetical protein